MNGYEEILAKMNKARKQYHNAFSNILDILDDLNGKEFEELREAYVKMLDGACLVNRCFCAYEEKHKEHIGE